MTAISVNLNGSGLVGEDIRDDGKNREVQVVFNTPNGKS